MNKFLLLIISLFISFSAFSQTQYLQSIWQLYQQTKQIISNNQSSTTQDCYSVDLKHSLPNVGTQEINYKMYFTFDMIDGDFENPYVQTLRLVNETYNMGKKNYTEEYLFDKGQLVYLYRKENFGTFDEYRYYFQNSQVVNLTVTSYDSQTGKNVQALKQFSSQNLPAEYSVLISDIINEAEKIKKMFDSLKSY